MIERPPTDPDATTRLECDETAGYTEKPGVHAFEYCPFCGHPVFRGDGHELEITVDA